MPIVKNIHYPPEATNAPPVGSVVRFDEVGSTIIHACFNGSLLKAREIQRTARLHDLRVARAIHKAEKQIRYQAEMLHDYSDRTLIENQAYSLINNRTL